MRNANYDSVDSMNHYGDSRIHRHNDHYDDGGGGLPALHSSYRILFLFNPGAM